MPSDRRKRRVPGQVLEPRQRDELGLEVVSSGARLALTRLLRKTAKASGEEAHQIELMRINRAVNLGSAVLGRPIYTLELMDWDYAAAEYAWHFGELELVMRRPDTPQLVEVLVDLCNDGLLQEGDVNAVLADDGTGIRLESGDDGVRAILVPLAELPDGAAGGDEHANVRKLVDRMDRAMQDKDWSLVLHTGASIFETVAKLTVPNPNVQNQSLGGWFSLYRNHSRLAGPLLDTIEEIFKRRNVEPLAGHGSVSDPLITQEEAIQVRELTVALVRLERTLAAAGTAGPSKRSSTI